MDNQEQCAACAYYRREKKTPLFWCDRHSPAFPYAEQCEYFEETITAKDPLSFFDGNE